MWWSKGTAYIVVVEQCVFLPLVGWWLAAEVYLLGEDELFSSCCSNALCPAPTPGLGKHISLACKTDVLLQGVLAMFVG